MKKIMTIAAGVLFCTVVFASGTDENPSSASQVAIMKNGSSTFKLIYKGSSASDVKVAIYDAKNKLVFSERVKNSDGFLRPYNFDGLAEGEYTIAITDESGKRVEKVAYQSGTINKLVNVKKIGDEQKYLLTAGGKGAETIRVNIFDSAQTLLHTESKSIKADFAQVYSLVNVNGPLTFEIIHENGDTKRIQY
jgi:hypothetical protein